jgi:hypothetical protein
LYLKYYKVKANIKNALSHLKEFSYFLLSLNLNKVSFPISLFKGREIYLYT